MTLSAERRGVIIALTLLLLLFMKLYQLEWTNGFSRRVYYIVVFVVEHLNSPWQPT